MAFNTLTGPCIPYCATPQSVPSSEHVPTLHGQLVRCQAWPSQMNGSVRLRNPIPLRDRVPVRIVAPQRYCATALRPTSVSVIGLQYQICNGDPSCIFSHQNFSSNVEQSTGERRGWTSRVEFIIIIAPSEARVGVAGSLLWTSSIHHGSSVRGSRDCELKSWLRRRLPPEDVSIHPCPSSRSSCTLSTQVEVNPCERSFDHDNHGTYQISYDNVCHMERILRSANKH